MEYLSPPLLKFDNISKRYKKRFILSDVNFSIKRGEIFALVGPSGGGKTTLLKVLMGMTGPNSGNIVFEGKDILKKIKYLRQNTGFASQENMLFEELSIKENCYYFGRLYGMKKNIIKDSFEDLLELLGLENFAKTQIKHLSGGMMKRANLLVSLIHKPKLLILDEPTNGLDPLLRRTLWTYIHEINRTGTTILVTSHLLEEIEENCDRVAILKNGTVITVGSPEGYKQMYGNDKSFSDIFRELTK